MWKKPKPSSDDSRPAQPSTFSTSCGRCTEIFTRSTERAAITARDAHAEKCTVEWIDDYEPNK